MDKITHELLRSWQPCEDSYKRFCQLFPEGTDLLTAIDGLVADNHDDWGFWLFKKCQEKEVFKDVTDKGYRNTGYWNTGYRNTGDGNAGNGNTGSGNTGDGNTGDMNTGYRNTGDMNTGNANTGDGNAGNGNTGNWNKANYQTGCFNTVTPDDVLVFNRLYSRKLWNNINKPKFIFNVIPNIWVCESDMTDAEKIANPKFYVAEGYLKSIPMEEAWVIAWKGATDEDKQLLKQLPNFDAAIFKEITGIDIDI